MSPYVWRLTGINMAKIFLSGFVFHITGQALPDFSPPSPSQYSSSVGLFAPLTRRSPSFAEVQPVRPGTAVR